MQAELYVLRLLHVVGGMLWVGAATVMAFWVFPSVLDAGPAGGQVMQGVAKRKFMVFMPVVALLTILSGVRLLMKASSAVGTGYFSTPSGMTYSISATIVLLAFAHGMATSRPLGNRMAEISKQMSEPTGDKAALGAEMKTVQVKLARNGRIVAVMLLIAAAGMALGRYM
jgi:uncharacterized membrane protein